MTPGRDSPSGDFLDMIFKQLRPYAVLMIILATAAVFYPPLVSVVVALAAIFVSGVIAVTGEHVGAQIQKTKAPD